MNADDFDVVIIGAGTAGLSAGAELEKNGKSYIILDKKSEIGLPVRSTGAVSLEWVKKIGMPVDPNIISAEIQNMSFRTESGKRMDLNFNKTVGFVYDFTKYEKYLADEFSGKKLNIRLNTRVNEVSGNEIRTDSEIFRAKNVIFAAGPQSKFGEKLGKNEVLVAYEEIRRVPSRKDFQMILWFSDRVPGGYLWDFAESEISRKIGVCFYPGNGKQPKEVLYEFDKIYPELKGEIISTMAHQIPLTKPVDTVVKGNYLYTGDMVNAVLNTTAGGLQGAFWSGKLAAQSIVAGNPMLYQQNWDNYVKPWLMRHHEMHRKMNRRGEKSVGRLITLAKMMPKSVQKRVFAGL
ncbi:NAD(P)/FAD-dependent oxidoreductase [Cuniculiplasma sp. SKW4]|uniref:NAD(P)/FAD-dependent oxidoreductase n=1 Tax=Cuniculiplasma sp. SKW4 TaxID=3400171 RepID=UPI003FD5A92B